MSSSSSSSTTGPGRNLIGYGEHPPDVQWPDNAKVAIQFVINYEEGGENCILNGDQGSEWLLSEIVGASSYPGVRHMNMESLYEVCNQRDKDLLFDIDLRYIHYKCFS